MKIKHLGIVGLTVAVLTVGIAFADGWGADPQASPVVDDQILGSLTSPDLTNPYLCINGACTWYNRRDMPTGTSTACVIKSPTATSTFNKFTAKINVATTTQAYMQLVKSTTSFAPHTSVGTSTANLLASSSIAVSKTTEFVYVPNTEMGSSTQEVTNMRNIAPPNTYFIYYAKVLSNGLQASTYNSGSLYSGTCTMNFEVI